MHLHTLSKCRSGYVGLLETAATYEWFKMTRKGRFNRLMVYQKEDFEDREHFKSIMTKFISGRRFFDPPIAVTSYSVQELDRVFASVASTGC